MVGTENWKLELCRCKGVDIANDDHGGLTLNCTFEAPGWGQGFGYRVDIQFVQKFMDCLRVEKLQHANGKPCWITHNYCEIKLMEPLLEGEGDVFDIQAWGLEARKRWEILNEHGVTK